MDRIRKAIQNVFRPTERTNDPPPERGTPSTPSALTLNEKKQIFLAALKDSYKKQYDAVQPIPYIKDRLYCVDKVFVEGSIEGFIERRTHSASEGSWERLDSYNHIFTDSRVKSARRIIEGEPGYGKSTLTLQLAYDWCNGVRDSPFSDADVLILLRLRQLGNVKSIYRAIKLFLLQDESRLKSSDIKAIIETCSVVKVLLDGFDEYPYRDKVVNSDIWQIIKLEMFQTFDVTLTTRYLPIDYARSETKQVKLLGFDEAARDQYIRKAITGSNNDDVAKIKEGLKGNSILDDLCQIPLFFVTFAHMTHEREDFRKFKSVTEFFIYMMRCFHSHTRNKADEHNVKDYDVNYEAEHSKLDQVAFEGLNRDNQQLVWDKENLLKRFGQGFYDHYIRVGILVEEEDVFDVSEGVTADENIKTRTVVRFYHKLFCEWFTSFKVSAIAAGVNDSAELEHTLGKMDPFDLQYVYRFACGLNATAGSKIIEYLKKRKDCHKFAILCILEQTGKVEDIIKTVTELCAKQVTINNNDSKLLQRSTVQLLQIASSHDIPISNLMLTWSFSKVENNTIILQSGMCLPSLSSLEKISMNTSGKAVSEEDVVGLLKYGLQSKIFKQLWFLNCVLPESIKPEIIPEESNIKNIKVYWLNNACQLDLISGQWKKPDDIQSITEMCSQVVGINNKSTESVQRSAVELLVKASNHDIPIYVVSLVLSFSRIDEDGNIILFCGIFLPILTSLERMTIQTESGREINKQDVIGILNYVDRSRIFKQLDFQGCLVPSSLPLRSSLSNLKSKEVKVFWMPYGFVQRHYQLDLQSGRWMLNKGADSFFTMKSYGDILTDADYDKEVTVFREHHRDTTWQQTWNVSR